MELNSRIGKKLSSEIIEQCLGHFFMKMVKIMAALGKFVELISFTYIYKELSDIGYYQVELS